MADIDEEPKPSAEAPKRRFHRAAMQILSQVVQNRILEQGPNDPEPPDEQKQKVAHPSNKPTARPPKRHTFANIARIYSLKKMTGGKSQLIGKSRLVNQVIAEDDFELPSNPRFCATLSPEAQYAMMKCYDDILVENIQHSFPETKVARSRVKTPVNTKVKLPEATSDRNAGKQVVGLSSLKEYDAKKDKQNGFKNKQKQTDSLQDKLQTKDTLTLSKETQLRLTGRFERAMDILDTIRESEGKIVTSHRYKSRDIKPVRHYNSWSDNWTKEFKFESKT